MILFPVKSAIKCFHLMIISFIWFNINMNKKNIYKKENNKKKKKRKKSIWIMSLIIQFKIH